MLPGRAFLETTGLRTAGRVTVDLLYGDHEAGRFVLLPGADNEWRCDITRHSSLGDNAAGA
jgi:hypothetical protein